VRADPAHLPGRKPVARLQFKFAAPSESATCDCIYPTGRCASKLPPDNATSPPQPTPNFAERLGAQVPTADLRYWLAGVAAPGEHRWTDGGRAFRVTATRMASRVSTL